MSSPQATRSQGQYGSKYHLSSYAAAVLDEAIVHALDLKPPKAPLEWIYPLQNETRAEPTGAEFLGLNLEQREVWAKFWPKSGTPQTWDGIARFQCPQGSTWILIEAKTNHPEFCSPACGAKSTASLSMIK